VTGIDKAVGDFHKLDVHRLWQLAAGLDWGWLRVRSAQ
jgi:hypothetical protein